MIDRQQRDELVASLQSLEELWETAAGVSVIQNNIIIENLRVADDTCKGDYPLLVVFFICMLKGISCSDTLLDVCN